MLINNYGYFHDDYLQTYRFEIEVEREKWYISPIKCIMMMSCIMAIVILMIMMAG